MSSFIISLPRNTLHLDSILAIPTSYLDGVTTEERPALRIPAGEGIPTAFSILRNRGIEREDEEESGQDGTDGKREGCGDTICVDNPIVAAFVYYCSEQEEHAKEGRK